MANIEVVTTRINDEHSKKAQIWKLLEDSYAGGQQYRDGNYLHRFSLREFEDSYVERKRRSIYANNVRTLVDMLVGFLYSNDVSREVKNSEILDAISFNQDIDSFMQKVAVHTCLYTTGILVDSPSFDPDDIKTEADRQNAGLKPYAIMYLPRHIRDWSFDKTGKLQWIILDNTSIDNEDPYVKQEEVTKYRLWTKTFYQDFIKRSEGKNEVKKWVELEPVGHDLGEVPFIFANWSPKEIDKIADTSFEDIALYDQAIYNYMSLFDEMLTGGTFKFLFYPNAIPEQLQNSGLKNYSVLTFDGTASHKPFFDGPNISDVDPFITAMDFYISAIFRKLGLDTDHEKNFTQSGSAKVYDFKRVQAFLRAGATSMEHIEKEIIRLYGKWIKEDYSKSTIEYKKDFLGEELENELMRLFQMINFPVNRIKEEAYKRIVQLTFSPFLKNSEMKSLLKDIETEMEDKKAQAEALDKQLLISQEKDSDDEQNENDTT